MYTTMCSNGWLRVALGKEMNVLKFEEISRNKDGPQNSQNSFKVTLDNEGMFWEIGQCAQNFSAMYLKFSVKTVKQLLHDYENLVSIYCKLSLFITINDDIHTPKKHLPFN